MKPDGINYDALIESLADGVDVDWSVLETAAISDKDRRRYGNLRLVARMAELHRTLALDDTADAAAGSTDDGPVGVRPETWGHLRVGERMAEGSFGEVYLAHDPQLDREVALKLLRSSTRRPLDRLLQEARTLARVRHPNVVTVHGAAEHDGRAGLWMERVDGQTLASWLRANGQMGGGEAAAVGADLCRALAAVHAAGLVHGDIKAQNVMRDKGGRIVLMDFGAGHTAGGGSAAGTPLYLAPEVLNAEAATPRSDIYSLGVLLFHLLTGKYPCSAEDLEGLRSAHAARSRVYLRDLRPDLPGPLVAAIERSLDADPARRFASAGEMERALTAGVGHEPRPRWSITLRFGVVALVVVAVIALAALWRWSTERVDTIAVMAFVEASGTSAYLMEGLTDDLVAELQQFDLEVKRGRPAPALAAAGAAYDQQLGAEAVVTGSAHQSGERTAVLVKVERAGGAGDEALWSREYDVAGDGVPALARQIAADVAEALGAKPRTGALAPGHQPNFRAYDAYLKGRAEQESREPASLLRSLAYFDQAASLDPLFAEPHAGKADTYLAMGVPAFGGMSPLEARRLAKASAFKALEINPHLVEAHTSLAFAAFVQDWDWPAAEERFKVALAINPQYALAHHWYAEFLNEMGRFDEALARIRRAQELDPMSLLINRDVAWHYFCQARYSEAITQLSQTLAMDPDFALALTLLARSLAQLGQFSEALTELERARPRISTLSYLAFRGGIEALAGQRANAEATMAALRDLGRTQYVPPYYLAIIHTALGENDQALTELEKGYAEQDTTMVTVNIDPRFAPLRNEPRFKTLMAKMRFPNSTP
jgi:serine/threonine-protein kinase